MSTTSIGNLIERFRTARTDFKGERLSLDFVYKLKGGRGIVFGPQGVGVLEILLLRAPFDDADKSHGLHVTLRDDGDLEPNEFFREHLMTLCADAGRFIPANRVASLNRYVRSNEPNAVAAQWVALLLENEKPNPRYVRNSKWTHCVYTISDVFNVSVRLLDAMQPKDAANSLGKSTGRADTTDALDELEVYLEPLTSKQQKIVRFLWTRHHATKFETLMENCWDKSIELDSVRRMLERINNNWIKRNPSLGISIYISKKDFKAKLLKPDGG